MPSQLWRSLLLAAIVAFATGCVDRRFVVATNVPAAQVSVDGHALGPAPVDGRWEYAGKYKFTASAPGYETLVVLEDIKPKWHDYPGLDFLAEVVWPFRIEDVRYVNLALAPAVPLRNEDLISSADNLRNKSMTLPPPSVPDDPPETEGGRPRPSTPGDFVPTPPPPRVLPYQGMGTYLER
jgi:hypothetical protein